MAMRNFLNVLCIFRVCCSLISWMYRSIICSARLAMTVVVSTLSSNRCGLKSSPANKQITSSAPISSKASRAAVTLRASCKQADGSEALAARTELRVSWLQAASVIEEMFEHPMYGIIMTTTIEGKCSFLWTSVTVRMADSTSRPKVGTTTAASLMLPSSSFLMLSAASTLAKPKPRNSLQSNSGWDGTQRSSEAKPPKPCSEWHTKRLMLSKGTFWPLINGVLKYWRGDVGGPWATKVTCGTTSSHGSPSDR
mmetsp:Transcript_57482/g.162982  ORF Transcript_57482/g.162982 Transcript_57482/m.162982 type:complete len:253 (+) Transcript_57482:873-1631(+)